MKTTLDSTTRRILDSLLVWDRIDLYTYEALESLGDLPRILKTCRECGFLTKAEAKALVNGEEIE